MTSERDGELPAAVTWGLLAAWAIHDSEELFTMSGWTEQAVPRLRERFPQVPPQVWEKLRTTPAQAAVAIGIMGGLVAAASARGAATGGRSRLYQTVLAGFGLHAITHVAQAAAVRGYTPGVVTAPLVVAPFSIWAWRRLRAAGVPTGGGASSAGALLALPAVAAACHAAARALAPVRSR
ncbi:HXXEE domain-containing protein [Planomonospora sp. ID82291]|uniref:HXXEE domain-containing protein n=1 Tax=Planomonospora sp. ID82291 TaxID=2738136 RepID=UPI0018C35AFD|nr:HXXEE domain-containing protein [Planomonospora sp. ID82291]MBG0814850.1 HXXEE domain-containing protein [Planomonospora sp. ID82291]